MAITLPSAIGYKNKEKDQIDAAKENILLNKENKRMKRREKIQEELDKVVKDRF